ncbi:MAG: glycerol-3-phosphate acyltransferase [Lachnospiraceae bacterium]|nr:glycerol-3-phosphate acyltransferase [Lachnospiraceae bacterium]
MARIVSLIIGYFLGTIQSGYLLGVKQGLDIRSVGSGNAGTTNMLRTFGVKAGALTLFLDVIKTLAAMFISWLIFGRNNPDMTLLYATYAGAGSILGHDFPFHMGFKGGKGIAATAGLIIGYQDPFLFCMGCLVFFGLFLTTHYVSLGSIMVWLAFFIEMVLLGENILFPGNRYSILAPTVRYELYVMLFLLGALAWFQHRGNISRLIQGKERRTYFSKEKNQAEAERFKQLNS